MLILSLNRFLNIRSDNYHHAYKIMTKNLKMYNFPEHALADSIFKMSP